MLALPTVEAQLTVLTTGRPVSSLFSAMLVLIVSPFTDRSKDPLSFLKRNRKKQHGMVDDTTVAVLFFQLQLNALIDLVKFQYL